MHPLLLILAGGLLCICAEAAAEDGRDFRAAAEGHALAERLRNQVPEEDTEFTGVLKMRDRRGKRTTLPVHFRSLVTTTNWQTVYAAGGTRDKPTTVLTIVHTPGQPDEYVLQSLAPSGTSASALSRLEGNAAMVPFATTDFWVFDLGLGFFHWPDQRLLRKEVRRHRFCEVLESANPAPRPDGYARVVSWIDQETGGLLRAEAYDRQNDLLKEFSVGSFKKIKGRYYLQDMKILTTRTDSRTEIRFDLDPE